MEQRPADKSGVKKSPLNKPKETSTEDGKKSNKEIREKYIKQLRSWLITVNSYQCHYNKLIQYSAQKKNKQVSKTPNVVPKSVPPNNIPSNAPETPNVASTQFVG